MAPPQIDLDGLEARIEALPGVERARVAALEAGVRAYLVGGSVRDALLGLDHVDVDIAVEGDHRKLVEALGGEARVHDRFGTAAVKTPDGPVDVAATRAESYSRPGALPEVRPAGIEEDLSRRDFSINALAVPLAGPPAIVDPHDGVDDLRAGVLRALHERSFADDPTRALRAARYAARLGLELDAETHRLLVAADLETVSGDRIEAELRKLAAEPAARRAFELAADWGLIELASEAGALIDSVDAVLTREPWSELASRTDAILAVRLGARPGAAELAAASPPTPSAAVELAHGHDGIDLVVARALGAEWLDRYVSEWRRVRLEISGADLLEAGVAQGPAIGRGLAAALRAKLDGEVAGAEEERRVALEAAGAS
jgi:tRNA nucleotidyltransferase (CCA-adding enzyme)